MDRRTFLTGILLGCTAPAYVRAASLMPIFVRSDAGLLLPPQDIAEQSWLMRAVYEYLQQKARAEITGIGTALVWAPDLTANEKEAQIRQIENIMPAMNTWETALASFKREGFQVGKMPITNYQDKFTEEIRLIPPEEGKYEQCF